MQKIVQGFLFIAFSQILIIIGGFVVNVFLTRFLGKNLFGLYSLIIFGILPLGLSLVATGFPQTLTKYISDPKEDRKSFITKLFLFQIGESIIITIFYFILSPFLASFFNESELFILLLIAACLIPTQAFVSILINLYNGLRKFHIHSLIVSSLAILRTILIVLLAIFWSVKGAILGYLFALSLIAIIFLIVSKDYFTKIKNLKLDKEIFTFFIHISLFNVELSLLLSLDLLMIKYFLSAVSNELVGIYSAGAVIAKISYFLIISLSSVMFPTVSYLFAKNMKEKVKYEIGQMIKISSIFLIPITLILASISPIIVHVLYGSEYLESSVITTILAFAYSFLGFYVIFSNIMNSIGKVLFTNIVSIITIIIDIILLSLFINWLGIKGAAIASTIAIGLGMTYLIFKTIKEVGIEIKLSSLAKINILGFIIFGGLNILLTKLTDNPYIWGIVIVLEVISYFLLLYLIKEYNIFNTIKEIISMMTEKYQASSKKRKNANTD